MFYTLQIESEKVVKELNRVKIEISEIISQKQLLKEANIRLNAQLEAMVEDSNVSLIFQSIDSIFIYYLWPLLIKNFGYLGYAECYFKM